MCRWRLSPAVCRCPPAALVVDTGYGANADFRHGLEDRRLTAVFQAKAEMTAHGQDAEPHQPAFPPARARPSGWESARTASGCVRPQQPDRVAAPGHRNQR
ncbi:transposase [Streptomyces sp. NPDC059851]|uniref:transposase n=1 Tax=Streptomyces sp. NPDC059851 TaxID=3346971 RepID=UPI00366329BF